MLAVAAAIVLGVILAVPIAWFNVRPQLDEALQTESRSGTVGRAAQTLRHSFIVAQIALALLPGDGVSRYAQDDFSRTRTHTRKRECVS